MKNFCYAKCEALCKIESIHTKIERGVEMRNMTRLSLSLGLIAVLLVPVSSIAGTYEDGMSAYQSGRYEEALSIWTWLAETGNVDAKFNLGFMYEFGYGVKPDESMALKWYLSAAQDGHEQAQRYVAWMFQNGKGTPKNPTAAKQWLMAANDQAEARDENADPTYAEAFFRRLCTEIVDARGRYDEQRQEPAIEPAELEASGQVS